LHVESVPGRQSFTIDSAWLEKGDAAPGDTLRVRVLLHPYRGPGRIEETTVHVPDQIARGTTLRILITDGDTLNRASRASHSLARADLPALTSSLAFSIASAETTACTSDSLCLRRLFCGKTKSFPIFRFRRSM